MGSVLWEVSLVIARLVIGFTLIFAGWAKLRNGRVSFLNAVLGYDLIPEGIAVFLARYLPRIEIFTGILLVVGLLSWAAALVAFGLFAVFTGAITISLLRGKENVCGCLGKLTPVQWRLVYRNTFLMGLLLPVYAFNGGALAIDSWIHPSPIQSSPVSSNSVIVIASIWGLIVLAVLLLQGLIRLRIVQVVKPQY